ncbi:ABC transporter permease/substrate-binding protein [uncultured Sphingobium sp.]|uniref:ABC transporter permease/substrate-binding protein n=1 Tax=uncultured Sphingobium sp. TaxID=316087 RepID=UPI00259B682F|nr:ABC transporter permease/substrate-binding protein [uncultured Sphingobium sp.]
MIGLVAAFDGLGTKLTAHVLLSAAALLLGIALALPLAVWASRSRRVAAVALGLASLVQTIPALALLALFYPVLVNLGSLTGWPIPAFGFTPALLALTLYALLPILRNAVTARQRMDPEVLEAADALGMTSWQKLRLVEAPLAMPFIVAGIRTAAVWTVGAATLATMVGQPSLGDPIFAGLQIQNWSLVLVGCTLAAGLALTVDFLIGQIEAGLSFRRRWQAALAGLAIVAGLASCLATTSAASGNGRPHAVIGAKNFSEQFILARLIGQRLEAKGYSVDYRDGLGSSVAYKAIAAGEIDVYVDYTGTLWASEMKRTDRLERAGTLEAIGRWTRSNGGVELVGPLGFENAYAFAMPGEKAKALGIITLDDLARQSPHLVLGADLEFLVRPEWQAVRQAYRFEFADTRRFAPSLMYNALASGDADVISAFSSDGRVAADNLVVLTDPRRALPGYDAVLLVSRRSADNSRFLAAIRPMVGRIGVDQMRQANYAVDRTDGKQSPEAAARALGCATGLGPCLQ